MLPETGSGLLYAGACAGLAASIRYNLHLEGEIAFSLLRTFRRTHRGVAVPGQLRRAYRLLLRDQFRIGRVYGEFGKYVSLEEMQSWNPKKERLSSKPRIYLTRWPCHVLRAHNLAPLTIARALKGLDKLFSNDIIKGLADWSEFPAARAEFDNYRHTMCAALILVEHRGWDRTTQAIVGRMVDAQSPWGTPDGGWRHSSDVEAEPDLYSCFHAAELLHEAANAAALPAPLRESAKLRLDETLDFIQGNWINSKWRYQRHNPEDMWPLAMIQLASVLRSRRPALFEEVLQALVDQLDPAGGLSHAYLAKCHPKIGQERVCARFAYALYRSWPESGAYRPLWESVMHCDVRRLASLEASFLLDIGLSRMKATETAESCERAPAPTESPKPLCG